jgi:hypothetical protein
MIKTRLKDIAELKRKVKNKDVGIIGCAGCTLFYGFDKNCLNKLSTVLNANSQQIIARVCGKIPEIKEAEVYVIAACGLGVQNFARLTNSKVIPAMDTIGIGNNECKACGNCNLDETCGICIKRCPKGIENGPCGGVIDGMCEVSTKKCVFIELNEKRL